MMKPRVESVFGDWQFVFPREMYDRSIYKKFDKALELLGKDEAKCQAELEGLISEYPECHIDAYNHLSISFRNVGRYKEAFRAALMAHTLGLNAMPVEILEGHGKLEWGVLDNRPFLRSCQILGLENQRKRNYNRANELFRLNLRLNPNDNQGIRSLLLENLLREKRTIEAKKLLNEYSEDVSTDFLFGNALVALMDGNESEFRKLALNANARNEFVAKQVISGRKNSKLASIIDQSYGLVDQSKEMAYNYWTRNIEILSEERVKEAFKKLSIKNA
jgi:tetratricopeptide (TPR) repeat protein